jgi:hypothetical protein
MTSNLIGSALSALFVLTLLPAWAQTEVPKNAPPCTSNCLTIVTDRERPEVGWIVGEIRSVAFGGDSDSLLKDLARSGWVECRGQSVPRSQFPELFKALGETWGALDGNTFLLPDLRGMFLRGWHHGRQAPPKHVESPYSGDRNLEQRKPPRPEAADAGGSGGKTGDAVGSVQPSIVQQHDHPIDSSGRLDIGQGLDAKQVRFVATAARARRKSSRDLAAQEARQIPLTRTSCT